MAEDAGALLVRSGLITEEQLLIARQAQAGRGGTVGEHLILAGFIDDDTLADFYRSRLMVPQVSARQLARIAAAVIAKIPAAMATEFRCVPVVLDQELNLTVAMADPSTTHTVDEIAFFTGHYVVRAVATQSQIAWCLANYYDTVTPLLQKLLRNPDSAAFPGPMPPALVADAPRDPDPLPSLGVGGVARRTPALVPALTPPEELPEVTARLSVPAADHGDRRAPSSPVPVAIEHEDEKPTLLRRPALRLPAEGREQKVISFLAEDTPPTGPMATIQRKLELPPELTPRAGELDVPTGPVRRLPENTPLPAVMVSLRRRTTTPSSKAEHLPTPAADAGSGPARMRSVPGLPTISGNRDQAGGKGGKGSGRRRFTTRLGMGVSDQLSGPVPVPVAQEEESTDVMQAAVPYPETWPSPEDSADSIHQAAERAAEAAARARSAFSRAPSNSDLYGLQAGDDAGVSDPFGDGVQSDVLTSPYIRLPESGVVVDHTGDDDDEWGPPGTTIPPSYLGAVSEGDEFVESATIPIVAEPMVEMPIETAMTLPAEAQVPSGVPELIRDSQESPGHGEGLRPGRRERSGPVEAPLSLYDSEHVTPEVLREFEDSQNELAEVLRRLQLADTRDAVIDILADHLGESHKYAAFFAVKSGRLMPWKTFTAGKVGHKDHQKAPSMSLERPSTFQDIVGTRLPFRGPVTDDISRGFIMQIFGVVPQQMLGLPVSVRERVVGVLYGGTAQKRVFVQNLGVLARAAGGALERILKHQKR